MIVLTPNSILNTFGQVGQGIFPENVTFSKQHLSLGKNIAVLTKKSVYLIEIKTKISLYFISKVTSPSFVSIVC